MTNDGIQPCPPLPTAIVDSLTAIRVCPPPERCVRLCSVSSASTAFPDAIPVLTDGVVTLRALRPEDSDAVVRYSSDPELGRWMTVPQPYTWADAEDRRRQSLASWATGERYQFAIETEGHLAGGVNLRPSGDGLA